MSVRATARLRTLTLRSTKKHQNLNNIRPWHGYSQHVIISIWFSMSLDQAILDFLFLPKSPIWADTCHHKAAHLLWSKTSTKKAGAQRAAMNGIVYRICFFNKKLAGDGLTSYDWEITRWPRAKRRFGYRPRRTHWPTIGNEIENNAVNRLLGGWLRFPFPTGWLVTLTNAPVTQFADSQQFFGDLHVAYRNRTRTSWRLILNDGN